MNIEENKNEEGVIEDVTIPEQEPVVIDEVELSDDNVEGVKIPFEDIVAKSNAGNEENIETKEDGCVEIDDSELDDAIEELEKTMGDNVDRAFSKLKKNSKMNENDDKEIDALEAEFPINWNKIEVDKDGLPVITDEDKRILIMLNLFKNKGDLNTYIETSIGIFKSIKETTDIDGNPIEHDEHDKKSMEATKKKLAYLQSIARDEAGKLSSFNNIYIMTHLITMDKILLYLMKNNPGITYGQAKEKLTKEGFTALLKIFASKDRVINSLKEWKDIDKYIGRHLKVYNGIKGCFRDYGDSRKVAHLRTMSMTSVLEKVVNEYTRFVMQFHTVSDKEVSSSIVNQTHDVSLLENIKIQADQYDGDNFYKNNIGDFKDLFSKIYKNTNRFNELLNIYKNNPKFVKFTEDMMPYIYNKREHYYTSTEECPSYKNFLDKIEKEIKSYIAIDVGPEILKNDDIDIKWDDIKFNKDGIPTLDAKGRACLLKSKVFGSVREMDEYIEKHTKIIKENENVNNVSESKRRIAILQFASKIDTDFTSNKDLDSFMALSVYEAFEVFERLNHNRLSEKSISDFALTFSNLIMSKLIMEGFSEILDLSEKSVINQKDKPFRDDEVFKVDFTRANSKALKTSKMVKGYIINFINNSISVMMSNTNAPIEEQVGMILRDNYIKKSLNVQMMLGHDRFIMRKNMGEFINTVSETTNDFLKSILETDSKVEWPWTVNIINNKSKNQLKKLNRNKKRK